MNTAPVAVADAYTVVEGGPTTVGRVGGVLANDTDADGDPLTALLVSGPTQGTLTLNANGSFTYTHDGSDTTSDQFTYQARDGAAHSPIATGTLTITPDNDPPIAPAHETQCPGTGQCCLICWGQGAVPQPLRHERYGL